MKYFLRVVLGCVDPANPHETIFIASRPDVTTADALAMTEVAGIVERLFGAERTE